MLPLRGLGPGPNMPGPRARLCVAEAAEEADAANTFAWNAYEIPESLGQTQLKRLKQQKHININLI